MNPALVWVDRYCGLKFPKQLVTRIFICFSNQQEAIIFLGFHLGQAGGWGLPLAIIKRMISGYFHRKKMKIGQKEHLSFSIPCLLIGHFRVPPGLCFKTRVGAQPLIFHSHANKTHFHKKGCAPSLILKVRVFGTRQLEIFLETLIVFS